MQLVNYSIKVTEDLKTKIKELSKSSGLTINSLLEQAIGLIEHQENIDILQSKIDKIENRVKQLTDAIDDREKGIKMYKE